MPKGRARPLDRRVVEQLNRSVLKLAHRLEGSHFGDFVELTNHPMRMMWIHFLSGLSRGIGLFLGGTAIGLFTLTIVSAVLLWILHVTGSIPVIKNHLGILWTLYQDFVARHQPGK